MAHVQKTASVAPSTVTRLSTGELDAPAAEVKRRRGRTTRTPEGRTIRVHEQIMNVLRVQGVDFRYVEVRSETEVVVRNRPVR